jgi:Epoxide hydrolase N terminus
LPLARHPHRELGKLVDPAVGCDRPAVLLREEPGENGRKGVSVIFAAAAGLVRNAGWAHTSGDRRGAEAGMPETRPHRIAVPDERLAAIRRRVGEFAWDDMPVLAEGGGAWSAGAGFAFMRELCDYWVKEFDWRVPEAALNRFPQVMARIGEQEIHVLHERGSGPRDAALVLTHGWPGSIIEFLTVIERFAHPERFGGIAADGIDVVVPALPGFGFSGRPAAPIGPRKIAGIWDHLLRQVLGYDRYIAQGGDWGSGRRLRGHSSEFVRIGRGGRAGKR